MVSKGMRRYRARTNEQAALIRTDEKEIVDPVALFGRDCTMRLEIGFGHGRFLSQMAAAHPGEAFIGVEHKDIRTTKTAHKSNQLGANNIRLFTDEALRFVRDRLPPACLHRCYILFPDPWPRPKHRRRRLVSRSFLMALSKAMAPGGKFIFASDTHNYSMQVMNNLSTLPPGLWKNNYSGGGYRINIPTRFPTVFEEHKKSEGCTIAYLMHERTQQEMPQ